jgi:hypothetical protein
MEPAGLASSILSTIRDPSANSPFRSTQACFPLPFPDYPRFGPKRRKLPGVPSSRTWALAGSADLNLIHHVKQLKPSDKLGPGEILAPIGRGGMGAKVFRPRSQVPAGGRTCCLAFMMSACRSCMMQCQSSKVFLKHRPCAAGSSKALQLWVRANAFSPVPGWRQS